MLLKSPWAVFLKGATSVLLGAMVAAPVWAGGKVSLAGWDERGEASTAHVEFDRNRMRVTTSTMPDGYLLLRGDDARMVMSVGGSVAVVDAAVVVKTMGARGRQLTDGTGGVREIVSLTDTGRRETVAGIVGSLYHLIYVDDNGQKMRAEVVLSQDPRIVEYTRGFRRLLTVARQASGKPLPRGANTLDEVLESRKLGVLRYADRLLVTHVDSTTPSEDRFALPSTAVTLPDFNQLRSILGGR